MQAENAEPTAAGERHHILDALRGWALAGVLIANMMIFIGFGYASEPERAAGIGAGLNDIAELLLEWLIVGKFYSLFSLLFGIGFAVQLQRLEARGEGTRRYVRRLAGLFLFGLAHLFLLWMGDILALYALMGGALLLFRRSSDGMLLRWAVALWLVPVAWSALIHFAEVNLAGIFYGLAMQGFIANGFDPGMSPATWLNGADYLTQLADRPNEILFRIGDLVYQMRPTKVLAMFLIGLWVGRRALFAAGPVSRPLLMRVVKLGLGLGLPLAFARAVLHMTAGDNGTLRFVEEALYCVSTPVLALGYAAGFALMWSHGASRLLAWPAPAGRMALTNYLSQSLIQTLLFTGAGLALGNAFGLAFVIPFGAAIFAAQVLFSRWWLTRFRFGPCEWLWRSLTYGRAQPLRLARREGIAVA